MNTTKQVNLDNNAENIGILGGTFDPIHYGHIKPTLAAAKWLALDKVKLMPAHIPPHKPTTYASSKQRLAMVKLVCQQYPTFTYDARELNRNTPSFTVETLQEIKAEQPNSRLFFFIGMDSFINFCTWHHYPKILQLCHLVVSARPNYTLTNLDDLGKNLLNKHQLKSPSQAKICDAGGILLAPEYHYDISSTTIREIFNTPKIAKQHLPEAVFDYIVEQKLYNS